MYFIIFLVIYLLCNRYIFVVVFFFIVRSLIDRDSPLTSQDRHKVLSKENLKSLCEERKRESRESQLDRLIDENNSLLPERSTLFEESSWSSRNDTMSETSTSVSLDTKKKRRRKRKKKRGSSSMANESITSTMDGQDDKAMDDSISTVTNSSVTDGKHFISINENDTKNGSQGDTDEEESEDVASEFVNIMQGGMTLLVITAIGSTNPVVVTTDGNTLSWCLKRKHGESKSISLDTISGVELGMPPKLQKHFVEEDQQRSFCLVLTGGKSASFLAPTSLERNALAQGFDALIRRRLLMKQAPDSNFDLGLDIDEVHIN